MAWELESGLPDNLTFTILDARFTTNDQYNSGQSLILEWIGETDDPDNAELSVGFSCGGGWDANDRGLRASHMKKKHFVKNSRIGKMISRCIELGAGPVLESRGDMTDASVWVGLKFHMARESFDYGGEIGHREFLMPNQFLGTVDQPSANGAVTPQPVANVPANVTTNPAAPSAPVNPPPNTPPNTPSNSGKFAPKALAAAIKFAHQAQTVEDWQILCAQDEDVLGDDRLLVAIYEDAGAGEGSLWLKYHKNH